MQLSERDAAALVKRIAAFFGPDPPPVLGVAVSGGSDSLALLALLTTWRDMGGPDLCAVTVDHGLRAEAADEAARVAADCARLGVPHDTREWRGWDGQGNLPDRARRARYGLMARWASERGVGHVALGHTADDQAETFLMRLSREAGLEGLTGMAPHREVDGVTFCRPVLDITRETLRDVLRARGMSWVEDPGNVDTHYARVRARAALAELAPLGITAPGLVRVVGNLRQADDTLDGYVHDAARALVRIEAGDLLVARPGFDALRDEIARRLLRHALGWVSGAEYPPRRRAMRRLAETIAAGRGMTLQGCVVTVRPRAIRVSREPRALAGETALPGALWDGRWRITGPETPGAIVAALGMAGLRACPPREKGGPPARSLAASPAVWRGGELLAAPLAGHGAGWRAELVRDADDFFAALTSH